MTDGFSGDSKKTGGDEEHARLLRMTNRVLFGGMAFMLLLAGVWGGLGWEPSPAVRVALIGILMVWFVTFIGLMCHMAFRKGRMTGRFK